MSDKAKWIGLAVGTLVIGALFGSFTGFLKTGTEATIAKNPAFAEMQVQIDKLAAKNDEQDAVDDGFREVHGTIQIDVAVNSTKIDTTTSSFNQLRGAILNE